MIFLDASALVKAYVREPGSPSVHGAISRLQGQLYLSRAVALEVLSTLARKHRRDEITRGQYTVARTSFLRELEVKFKLLELRETDFVAAFALVDAYRRAGVGPLDVLHLASALHLQAKTADLVAVASSDGALLAAARSAGLPTFDPEKQPLGALIALVQSPYPLRGSGVLR